MAQVTSANISAGTDPPSDGQVEAMVAGASGAATHNERVRIGRESRASRG